MGVEVRGRSTRCSRKAFGEMTLKDEGDSSFYKQGKECSGRGNCTCEGPGERREFSTLEELRRESCGWSIVNRELGSKAQ